MSTPDEPTWEEREPTVREAIAEAGRLARRGLRRWWISIVPPLLFGGWLGSKTYATETRHIATVLFTLPAHTAFGKDTTDFMRSNMSPAQQERGAYTDIVLFVNNFVVTDEALFKAAQGYPEYADVVAKGPQATAAAMRKGFSITQSAADHVGQAEDELADPLGGFLRLQCVSDTYSKLTLKLCLEVMAIILTADAQLQLVTLTKTMGQQEYIIAARQDRIRRMQKELVDLSTRLVELRKDTVMSATEVPPRTPEEAQIYAAIDKLTLDTFEYGEETLSLIGQFRRKMTDIEIGRAIQQRGVASTDLHLTVVDAGLAAPPDPFDLAIVTLLGTFVPFIIAFPFALFVVGAIDTRIYRPEDVEFYGMHAIGLVELNEPEPAFELLRQFTRRMRPSRWTT